MTLQASFVKHWQYWLISRTLGAMRPQFVVFREALLKMKRVTGYGNRWLCTKNLLPVCYRHKQFKMPLVLPLFHSILCKQYSFQSGVLWNSFIPTQMQSTACLHHFTADFQSSNNEFYAFKGKDKSKADDSHHKEKNDSVSHTDTVHSAEQQIESNALPFSDDIDWESEMKIIATQKRGPLEEADSEEISHVSPTFVPSCTLAAYANKSLLLQKMMDLGVQLYKWEKMEGVAEFILKLDYEKQVVPHIRFLHDNGVPAEELGSFLTRNPHILEEPLDNFQARLNYLNSKKFTPDMISRIVTKNPHWLMFSIMDIDCRLGHFQNTFKLSGDEVRYVAVSCPQLITLDMKAITTMTFTIKEEMGFQDEEIRDMLLKKPRIWMKHRLSLMSRFDYVHNKMKIPHKQIVQFPEVLMSREFRLKQRHLFLQHLNRDQFDPTREGYVTLKTLVSGSDADFCSNVAKSSVDTFNKFLKTL